MTVQVSIVDNIVSEHRQLSLYLLEHQEISLLNTHASSFRKFLLMTIASFFEDKLKILLLQWASQRTKGDTLVVEFIRRKALERNYHTLFDWDKSNANKFFSLFGDQFRSDCASAVANDPTLRQSIVDFIQIGSLRNALVHQNFASFEIEKNDEDLYATYQSAVKSLSWLEIKLNIDQSGLSVENSTNSH